MLVALQDALESDDSGAATAALGKLAEALTDAHGEIASEALGSLSERVDQLSTALEQGGTPAAKSIQGPAGAGQARLSTRYGA